MAGVLCESEDAYNMTTDNLSKQTFISVDTLNNKVAHLANTINSSASDDFDFKNTLIIALIGAMIGQALVIFISWIKSKMDLNTKEKLLITDLKNQKLIIIRLKKEYQILLEKFEKKT